jgi:hypothetical protein
MHARAEADTRVAQRMVAQRDATAKDCGDRRDKVYIGCYDPLESFRVLVMRQMGLAVRM